MTELGEVVGVVGVERYEIARPNEIDVREAAVRALKVHLMRAVFVVAAGADRQRVPFQLNEFLLEWPEGDVELNYPCVAVSGSREPYAQSNFNAEALEETQDVWCPGSVLWRTGESEFELQLDFFTTEAPERVAIAAQLPELFNVREAAGGVVLMGPCEYYSRPIRFTLLEAERIDTGATVQQRERRLRAVVRVDAEVLQLRKAVVLDPRIMPPEVVDLEVTGGA